MAAAWNDLSRAVLLRALCRNPLLSGDYTRICAVTCEEPSVRPGHHSDLLSSSHHSNCLIASAMSAANSPSLSDEVRGPFSQRSSDCSNCCRILGGIIEHPSWLVAAQGLAFRAVPCTR